MRDIQRIKHDSTLLQEYSNLGHVYDCVHRKSADPDGKLFQQTPGFGNIEIWLRQYFTSSEGNEALEFNPIYGHDDDIEAQICINGGNNDPHHHITRESMDEKQKCIAGEKWEK